MASVARLGISITIFFMNLAIITDNLDNDSPKDRLKSEASSSGSDFRSPETTVLNNSELAKQSEWSDRNANLRNEFTWQ